MKKLIIATLSAVFLAGTAFAADVPASGADESAATASAPAKKVHKKKHTAGHKKAAEHKK
jgi:opacity protein-like surface antigen